MGCHESLVLLCTSIQHLSTSIQQISSFSNFVLHRTQCLCLAKSYSLAAQHVLRQVSTCLDRQDLLPSLSELHHAMLQGRKFLCDCLFQDGWVNKSLVLALSTEAQNVCLHDLVWCLCVIHRAMGSWAFRNAHDQGDNIYGTLNDIWAEASQEEDMRVLLDALERQIAGWKLQLLDDGSFRTSINAQCCMAEFLLHRLTRGNENATAAQPFDALPQYLQVNPHEITIKETIGIGPYAVVHEVEWHGQMFAHKEFLDVPDETVMAGEAAIQARLRHPNLLPLICWTSKPWRNNCALVTELMDRDLRAMIDCRKRSSPDPPFSLLTSVDLMLQIAKGMEHLHSLHILHRNLKSSNLLVTSMEESSTACRIRLKIAGFGLAEAQNQSSHCTTAHAGMPNWMAPEVLHANLMAGSEDQASTKYTKKADVYSFAVVCYEILSGKTPFHDGGERTELHRRLLKGERPKLPSSCPPYLANYIEKCWQGDPEKRPSFDQICRTFRHLKGILLSSTNSSALSTRGLSLIEDKLEADKGANWLSTASEGITTKLITILFEMSCYRVMEGKLTNKEITKVEKSSVTLRRCQPSGCWPLSPRHTRLMPQKGVEKPEKKQISKGLVHEATSIEALCT